LFASEGFMRIGRAAAWAFGAITLFVAFAVESAEICPEQLGAGEVNDGKYHFLFKSWGWAASFQPACNCIWNASKASPLYAEWQGINLRGFVPARESIYVYDDYSTNEHEEIRTPLFYGLGLKQIDALTMIPKESRRSSVDQNIRFAQTETPKPDATDNRTTRRGGTKTEGKIYIPSESLSGTKSDMISEIENGKVRLMPVFMRFTS
jgi:hypothetical protein